jgi:sugar/nucleoside kinase (ribokinase family)
VEKTRQEQLQISINRFRYNHGMLYPKPIEPVDYLAIGHITRDITSDGEVPGGTVLYSAMTAQALGLRVGIVTSCDQDFVIPPMEGITVHIEPGESTTTFENIYTPEGRIQIIHEVGNSIGLTSIPETWRNSPIVHIAPVAREVDPQLARYFSRNFVCVTPQGYMRAWNEAGNVTVAEWPESAFFLENAAAAIFSIDDIGQDEKRIEEMLHSIRVLAITEGADGVRVYWNGDVRRFRTPVVDEVESTGAGDIFAACFFTRYYTTRDPWEAGRFAVQLAAMSVTRKGMDSIPTPQEIQTISTEIIQSDRNA